MRNYKVRLVIYIIVFHLILFIPGLLDPNFENSFLGYLLVLLSYLFFPGIYLIPIFWYCANKKNALFFVPLIVIVMYLIIDFKPTWFHDIDAIKSIIWLAVIHSSLFFPCWILKRKKEPEDSSSFHH